MTQYEQAYLNGFSKVAQSYGIDSEELLKIAFRLPRLKQFGVRPPIKNPTLLRRRLATKLTRNPTSQQPRQPLKPQPTQPTQPAQPQQSLKPQPTQPTKGLTNEERELLTSIGVAGTGFATAEGIARGFYDTSLIPTKQSWLGRLIGGAVDKKQK